MKRRFHFLLIFVFSFCSGSLVAYPSYSALLPEGDEGNLKDLVLEGIKLLDQGFYGAALPYWEKICQKDSANIENAFKIGLCFRFSLDEQDKALKYFSRAAIPALTNNPGHSSKYSIDALFFLGDTWLHLNEPDSALKYYLLYREYFIGPPAIPTEDRIIACINSRIESKAPRNVKLVNLGEVVNSEYSETSPVLTLDNSVLFFSSRRLRKDNSNHDIIDKVTGRHFEDIYYTKKDETGKWQNPVPFKYNTDRNEAPLLLSSDGLTLYFRCDEKDNSDLFESHFKDGVWEKPIRLGSNINSPFNETGLSISADGKQLYFASDRPNGFGGSDLYRCDRSSAADNWGRARNLGHGINSAGSEASPYLNPNGKTLFFSSNGYIRGMGGFDIFYTEVRDDKTFTPPQSIGFPINNTRDNINYYLTTSGLRYCSDRNEGKSFDIYGIEGGGFDVENVSAGTEVIKLTTEMNVTEVLEVKKEVEKEVAVVEMVETPAAPEKPKEPEAVDVEKQAAEEAAKLADEATKLAEKEAKEKADLENRIHMTDTLNLSTMAEAQRNALIEKVKKYIFGKVEKNEDLSVKTVYFPFNSGKLSGETLKELDAFLLSVKQFPNSKIEIVGHTDNSGEWGLNSRISHSRAESVYNYLIAHHVSKRRIIFYGRGSLNPVATNENEEGRRLNRRAELVLIKN